MFNYTGIGMRIGKLSPISIIVLFLSITFTNINSQSALSDTLIINELLNKADSLKINLPLVAMHQVDSALLYARKLNLNEFIVRGMQKKFEVYYSLGKYTQSLETLRFLEKYYSDNKDTLKLAIVYNDMGLMYTEMSEYPSALELLHKAIELRGTERSAIDHASTLGNIGMTYIYSEKWEDAINYTQQALEIFKEIDWQEGIATMNSNLGSIYTNLENFDTAKVHLELALEIYQSLNHKEGIARSNNLLGMVYYYSGQIETSLPFFELSAKIRKEMGHQNGYLYSLNNIAYIYNKLGRKKEAIKTFQEGLNNSDELDDKRVVILLLKNISDIYAQIGDYKKAFDYKQQYIDVNNEVLNKEKNEQIEELKIKFETEQKEAEITNLKEITFLQEKSLQDRQIIIFLLSGSLVLLVILGYSGYSRYRLKTQQKSMQLEQRLLRSQMNPHFIFNSLSVIQGYIFKGNPTEAANYLANFGKLMRHILENSREEYVSFNRELETLNLYLELQNIRNDNSIKYDIEITGIDDFDSIKIPPMIAQPFIENSIKHGLAGKENLSIRILYKLIDDKIECIVEDDGVGIKSSAIVNNPNHKSLATEITKDRIRLLSKNKKSSYNILVEDLSDFDVHKCGTKVTVYLPYIEDF